MMMIRVSLDEDGHQASLAVSFSCWWKEVVELQLPGMQECEDAAESNKISETRTLALCSVGICWDLQNQEESPQF